MQRDDKFSDDLAAYISRSLLQAGPETMATIMVGFVQAMVISPNVAKTAQMGLDRVCGDRMPDLNDVPNLPYIRACAKESLRWMPGRMLGILHSVTQDDTYMGYHIPRGSTVMMNCRMHQALPRGKQIGAKSSASLNDGVQLPNKYDKALKR